MYEVKLSQYSGPLEKLLELIEARRLEITTVNLSGVTADFIEYVKNIEAGIHPRLLSDFIVVASRLMLIKSKVLLPGLELTSEEERDIHDLENRLKLYREFKAAGKLLGRQFLNLPASAGKPFLHLAAPIFYPGKLSVEILKNAVARVLKNLEILIPKEERTVKRALFTVEGKMQELLMRMSGALGARKFGELLTGKERGEVVILFLAVLHLARQQKISVSQIGQFDDIIIQNI